MSNKLSGLRKSDLLMGWITLAVVIAGLVATNIYQHSLETELSRIKTEAVQRGYAVVENGLWRWK